MSERPQFQPRVVAGVILVGVLLSAALIYVIATAGGGRPAYGPYPASTSAIGYQGLVRLLRDVGITVSVVGRLPGARQLDDALVILSEPDPDAITAGIVFDLLSAPNLLVILPKWRALPDPGRDDWIAGVRPLDPLRVKQVLALADFEAELFRVDDAGTWRPGPLPAAPFLPAPQLVRSDRLAPVVAAEQGMLLGRLDTPDGTRWLLSDPDLLSNHGLKRQSDPAVATALIDAVLGGGHRIYFLDLQPALLANKRGLVELLFSFPAIIVTGQVGFAAVLLLWAASARFGRPRPADRGLPPGTRTLIENAADLLDFAGHHAAVTRRYFEITLASLAERLHLPRGLNSEQQLDWLERIAEARGAGSDGTVLARRIRAATEAGPGSRLSETQSLDLARMIDRWKEELLDEPRGHPGNH